MMNNLYWIRILKEYFNIKKIFWILKINYECYDLLDFFTRFL